MYSRIAILALFLSIVSLSASAQCTMGDCINGTGTLIMKNLGRYTGEFSKGKFDGKGIFYYQNGDKYLGHWSKDLKNGKGKLITADYSYIGYFKNDQKHGNGMVQYRDGKTIKARWDKDILIQDMMAPATESEPAVAVASTSDVTSYKFNKNCNQVYCHKEYGSFVYRDGSEYKGYFMDGKPNGRGMVTYYNGALYDGDWAYDAPHGEGVYLQTNGERVSGTWDMGKLIKRTRKKRKPQNTIANENKSKPADNEVKIWAVIVGIAAYNHMPALKFTDDDAYKMYAFLKSPEGGALPDTQIKVLVDDEATKNGVLGAMETLYEQADANDVVMLYFSGHGLSGSFIPYDFDGYNNKIEHSEIQSILDASDAKHKVCYVDACYSGGLATGKGTLQESIKHFYSKFEETAGSSAVLMSSKENEISLEFKGLRQGVFTHFLMRGLKGEADKDQNDIVTINELYEFVTAGVRQYTAYQQTPVINGKYNKNMPVAMIR